MILLAMGYLTLVMLALSASPSRAQAGEDKLKVAVLDLRKSDHVDAELARSLTALIPQVLDELGAFKAISMEEIRQMLALEQVKQMLGCDDVSCLAELGGAVGAQYMVSGSILLSGDAYLLQLQLSNIAAASVEGRVSRDYKGSPGGLADEVRTATKLLVRGLLAAASGQLAITANEAGATVRIDGSIVGTTPTDTLALAGGVHTLIVEKEGFVRFSKDIEIQAGGTTSVQATLKPAGDFLRQYRTAAERTRSLALSSITAGGVAVVGAGALYWVAGSKARALDGRIDDYQAKGASDVALYDAIERDRKELAVLDVLTVSAAALGALALGAGLVLYTTGDDPDHYDDANRTGTTALGAREPTFSLILAKGGVGVRGRF